MAKTFITSDIHLSHINILKYCPHRWGKRKPDQTDPTPDDVSYMNTLIISNWNSTVSADDTVWILGDVTMGQLENAHPWVSQLNGHKHLVIGNHDKGLMRRPELVDLFESTQTYKEITHGTGKNKVMICMSHFPMRYWNQSGTGSIMLHGHLHGSPCDVPGRIMDVGMDTNNLFPYLLDDVVRRMLKIEVKQHHHGDNK